MAFWVVVLLGGWLVGAATLHSMRIAARPHCCGSRHVNLGEVHEWESVLAVGALMLGGGFVWRLRRDIYA